MLQDPLQGAALRFLSGRPVSFLGKIPFRLTERCPHRHGSVSSGPASAVRLIACPVEKNAGDRSICRRINFSIRWNVCRGSLTKHAACETLRLRSVKIHHPAGYRRRNVDFLFSPAAPVFAWSPVLLRERPHSLQVRQRLLLPDCHIMILQLSAAPERSGDSIHGV